MVAAVLNCLGLSVRAGRRVIMRESRQGCQQEAGNPSSWQLPYLHQNESNCSEKNADYIQIQEMDGIHPIT